MQKKQVKRTATLILMTLVSVLLIIIVVFYGLSFYWQKTHPVSENIKYGVTFSPHQTDLLGLDWKEVYAAILDDLKVRNFRLPSYWTIIEKNRGEYNFEETDYLVNEAGKRNANVILTLGVKQPRWPECHLPDWARNLSKADRQQKTLDLIETVVNRYKNSPAITAWQVENEPFLYPFGENCYPPDANFLKQEVELVRSLDSRPIIISDSGELSSWARQMQLSDIFGTTLYRTVWNPVTKYTTYPVIPGFYPLKADFFKTFFAPNNQKTIITELQSEPWIPDNNPLNTPIEKQMEIFPLSKMQDIVEFAKQTGMDEIYLWGPEWWYFMKQNGHPEYWNYAKQLFNQN